MASIVPAITLDSGSAWRAALARYWPVLALMVAALLIRAPVYGNADVHLDEEFYLLVGDRMVHGAMPYVDIWDRKPIGLFLLFAAIRSLGGAGVVQYQVVASLFAGATAGIIWVIVRRSGDTFSGIAAGLAYLFWINVFSGWGGQSPVFYNLFTAIAAWMAFRANDRDDLVAIARLGAIAMTACGLALQFKYTAAPEGSALALWLLWRLHQQGMATGRLMGLAILYAGIALTPTLMALLFFSATGHFDAFVYANFLSIFDRGRLNAKFLYWAGQFFLYNATPLVLFGLIGLGAHLQQRKVRAGGRDVALLMLWLAGAALGFVMIGNFYDHYFLPLVLPLVIAAAPLFTRTPLNMASGALLFAVAILGSHWPNIRYNRDKQDGIQRLSAAVAPYVHAGRCLYIYDGPAVIYMTAGACSASKFVYPDHLSNAVEAKALGQDSVVAMADLLAKRPGAIITSRDPVIPRLNAVTLKLLRHALARDYRCVAAVETPDRPFYVWAARDLIGKAAMAHAPRSCPDTYDRLAI